MCLLFHCCSLKLSLDAGLTSQLLLLKHTLNVSTKREKKPHQIILVYTLDIPPENSYF